MIKACENYDLVIEKMHKVIKGLKAHPKILTKPEHKYLHPVFDKILYNALCNLDLITELKYLDLSNLARNYFEMNFFARITALSCFEIFDNTNRIVGKEIIELIRFRLGEKALHELNTQTKELNVLKNRHASHFKKIRNNLIGHRMNAGHVQAEEMLRLEPKQIYEIGNRVFKIQLHIQDAFIKVLREL